MQKRFAIVSDFIPFAALQGGIMNCTDGDTPAAEILSLASAVVCLILLTIRHIRWQQNHYDSCNLCGVAAHFHP